MEEPLTNEGGEGLYYTKKEPKKMLHTYMRNQNKSYINSFNMIDRKAAIMIKMNTTVISVVMFFFRHIVIVPYGKFIGIFLVITSVISLAFAMEASRPMVLDYILGFRRKIKNRYARLEEDVFAIGMTPDVSLEQYEQAYNKLIKSQSLLVGAQVRTMYLFEKKVKKSFILMELSYTLFILGFFIAVTAFVTGNF